MVNKMELQKHVSIEITNNDANLISSIKQKLVSISTSHCICRVPPHLSHEHGENYAPALVSIGPLHRGLESLKVAEDHKWGYLNALLNRSPDSERVLDSCVRALREVEKKARSFYRESIDMGTDEFVEMLFLDGCFIVELLLESSVESLRRRDAPFFASSGLIQRLRCDLILFENQVPFFVLERMFQLVHIPKQCRASLFELAFRFLRNLIPGDRQNDDIAPHTHHFLDLIRQHYLPTVPKAKVLSGGYADRRRVTQLLASGIRVERSDSESPSDLTFSNGELKIPSLIIEAQTEIVLRNLIAMEFCDPRCSKHVASYVFLMKGLIRSRADVRLLGERGILVDDIGHGVGEGQIVSLFGRMNVELGEGEFYYKGVCDQMNGYEKRGLWKSVRDSYHVSHFGIVGLSLAIFIVVLLFIGGLISALYFLLHHFH